jgi:serine/threonine protein kinase
MECITPIGSGSYGTVFAPPINRVNNKTDDLVGKVLLTDNHHDITQEWDAGECLREIDPENKHFIYPLEKTQLTIQEYNKYAKKQLKYNHPSKQLTQFIMKNGGQSIRSIARQSSLSFTSIVQCVLDIAQCIKVLQKNHLIHQDIHPGNIVKKDDKHRLIDFGMMITSSQYYTPFNMLLDVEYAISPPEYRLLQYYRQKNNSIKYEQSLLAKYVGINVEDLNDIFHNRYFIMSYNYLVKSLKDNKDSGTYLKQKKSYNKADVYSLGVCIIEMLSYLDEQSVPAQVAPQLSFLIVRMLMPHPENRIDIDTVIDKFTTINMIINNKNTDRYS